MSKLFGFAIWFDNEFVRPPDVRRIYDANRPRHEHRVWTTTNLELAQREAASDFGRVIAVNVLEKAWARLVRGEIVLRRKYSSEAVITTIEQLEAEQGR